MHTMLIYIARRLVWTVVVILVVLFITFLVFFKLPNGDPALRFAGKSPTPEQLDADPQAAAPRQAVLRRVRLLRQELRHRRRERLARARLLVRQLRLGQERDRRARAADACLIVGRRAPSGSRSGWRSACSPRSSGGPLVDRAAMGFALFGISAPVFWLGLMALFIFWSKLGTGPADRATSPFIRRASATWFSHLILPWSVLALLYMAIYARLTRNNLLETLGEDYIRTARAKGLSRAAGDLQARAAREPDADRDACSASTSRCSSAARSSPSRSSTSRGSAGSRSTARSPRTCRRVLGVVLCTADRGRDHEPRRRHRLRVPRPARAGTRR